MRGSKATAQAGLTMGSSIMMQGGTGRLLNPMGERMSHEVEGMPSIRGHGHVG